MRDVPPGVLLLYTANKGVYTARFYSTTARTFMPDPLFKPKSSEFKALAPLLMIKKPPKSIDNLDK